MGNRLSKIYTRTGDDGSTGLGDGSRVAKDDLRVEALGTIDELNAAVGLLITEVQSTTVLEVLTEIQHLLFELGGELCIPGTASVQDEDVGALERWLDELNAALPPLKDFVLPGGGRAATSAHLARTICRRAERRLIELDRRDGGCATAIRFTNRLSDLLFVIARVLARAAGDEVLWRGPR
jgi:cob(I)alamin adenosyltransferase